MLFHALSPLQKRPRPHSRLPLCLTLGIAALASCHAPAPASRATSLYGDVRADSQLIADRVADMVDELHPKVLETLPESVERSLDVWVQETPTLYRFTSSAYEEADGFWAETPSRIHLRRDADDLRRTLAHELTHAALGPSWHVLPGTIEEGLCDLVSVELCPEGASLMRAGRLSAAAFALGGLELELELEVPRRDGSLPGLSYIARILLQSNTTEGIRPLDVFDVRAGLSSTKMHSTDKKAYYGLSYVVVDRIVSRRGIAGLHALCLRARELSLEEVPTSWLVEAAGLDEDPESWRRAIREALGADELHDLVRMYPGFVVEAFETCTRAFKTLRERDSHGALGIRLRLPRTESEIRLTPPVSPSSPGAPMAPPGLTAQAR